MLTLWFRLGLYRFSRNREADKGKNKGKKTGQNEITPGGGMTEICGFMKGNFRLRLLFILWTIRRISWWYRGDNLCWTPVVCSSVFQTSFPWNDSRVPVGHMIYMDTMAGPGLMGIVVPMGQRQQRKYKGVNPVTMNRYLSRFEALCNWYNPGKQRLHVHLGNREYRRLLLGTPQTPSFRKRTSSFIIIRPCGCQFVKNLFHRSQPNFYGMRPMPVVEWINMWWFEWWALCQGRHESQM